MKSPQIANVIQDQSEKDRYSDFQVLRSAAGYYIGTIYTDKDGFSEPGSRDSEYFPTAELAQKALTSNEWSQRDLP